MTLQQSHSCVRRLASSSLMSVHVRTQRGLLSGREHLTNSHQRGHFGTVELQENYNISGKIHGK